MVDYSQEQATASELASGYTDEGFVPGGYVEPSEGYAEMNKAGVTVESTGKLNDSIKKQQAPNPKLKREKWLKILFLQYINKYLSNPNKYIKHPKQIKQLPSWFDEAMGLFKESELSRYQKKMIREFFYGLIQYRDSRLVTEKYGEVNTEEVNRQLGESSPYSESGGLGPELEMPRERELQRDIDMRDLMQRTKSMDINKPSEEVPFEEYGGINPYTPPVRITSTTKGKATLGALGLGTVNPSNSTVNDYVKYEKKEQVIPGDVQSNPVQKPFRTNTSPVASILRSNKGASIKNGTGSDAGSGAFGVGRNMLGGMFGNLNRNQMLSGVGLPIGRVQETPTVVNQAGYVERKKKSPKIKLTRKVKRLPLIKKQSPLTIKEKSVDVVSKVLKNVNAMNPQKVKPLKSPKYKPSNVTNKTVNGLATVRNMDKLFTQVRNVSSNEFGRQNMKMKVVSSIKEQCDKAFARNKFKQESMKMKKNYFNDVKAAYPKMKMDIDEMGDIKENYMMQRSMHDVPTIVNSRRTTSSMMVKRGDMRPQSMGIMEYDFSIEPLGGKKRKRLELLDEDDFIER